jgi:hypothetical protein
MTDPRDPSVLDRLREAGIPVDRMPPAQRAAMAALTPEEADVLISLKERLEQAEPDVVAHAEWAGGVVW